MDVEAAAIAYLAANLSAPVYGDVPSENRPESFVTVERTGGGVSSVVCDAAALAIQCWAPTRAEASALAYETRAVLPGLASEKGVAHAAVTALYNFPAERGEPRYQITCDTVCRADI